MASAIDVWVTGSAGRQLLTGSRRMIGIATAPLAIEKDPFFLALGFLFIFGFKHLLKQIVFWNAISHMSRIFFSFFSFFTL